MKKAATRQIILEAVAICIEMYGIDKTTTRKIAQEAGTNIASINYYFSSKDELIREALGMTLNHMLEDIMPIIENQDASFQEVFNEVLIYLLEGAARFPQISLAHVYPVIVEKQKGTDGQKVFSRLFDALAARTVKDFPRAKADQIRFGLETCLSAMMLHMLAPNFFSQKERFSSGQLAKHTVEYFIKNLAE